MVEKLDPSFTGLLDQLEAAQKRSFYFEDFDACQTFTMALDI